MRRLTALVIAAPLALALWLTGGGRAEAADRNSCGCYKGESGACYCDKKAKCGCPGDCEPRGCEEARAKEMDKEVQAETKKAEEAERHQADADEVKAKPEPKPAKPARPKLSAARGKELVKLIDLYLADHPDARDKSIRDMRNSLTDGE